MLIPLSCRVAICKSVAEVLVDGCGSLGSCKPQIYFIYVLTIHVCAMLNTGQGSPPNVTKSLYEIQSNFLHDRDRAFACKSLVTVEVKQEIKYIKYYIYIYIYIYIYTHIQEKKSILQNRADKERVHQDPVLM